MLIDLVNYELLNKAIPKAEGKISRKQATEVHKKDGKSTLPPGGVWRTIRGHHVYIVGNKVVAGSLPWVSKKGEVKAKKATKAHLKEYQAHIDKENSKTEKQEKPKKAKEKKTATTSKTKTATKKTSTKKTTTKKTTTEKKVEKVTVTEAKKKSAPVKQTTPEPNKFYMSMKDGTYKPVDGRYVDLGNGVEGFVTVVTRKIPNSYHYNHLETIHQLELHDLKTGVTLHTERVIVGPKSTPDEILDKHLPKFLSRAKFELNRKYQLDTEEGRKHFEGLVDKKVQQLGYAPHYNPNNKQTDKQSAKQHKKVEKVTATEAKKMMVGKVPPKHRELLLDLLQHETTVHRFMSSRWGEDFGWGRTVFGRLYNKDHIEEAINQYLRDPKIAEEFDRQIYEKELEEYKKKKAKFDEDYQNRMEGRRNRDLWAMEQEVKRRLDKDKQSSSKASDEISFDDLFSSLDDDDAWDNLLEGWGTSPKEKEVRKQVEKEFQKRWDKEEEEYRKNRGIEEPKPPKPPKTLAKKKVKKSVFLYILV